VSLASGPPGGNPPGIDLFERIGSERDRQLEQLVRVHATAGSAQQQAMLEVELRRARKRLGRQDLLPTPQRGQEIRIESERRAVIAVVVRMVIALLLARVHAVDERGVEQSLNAIHTAQEASTADEHDRLPPGLLARRSATASMPAGDVIDRDALAAEDPLRAQHGRPVSQMRTNVQDGVGDHCQSRPGRKGQRSRPPAIEQTGDRQMAHIRKQVLIDARPEDVWAAVRDWGALHVRLVPGFVVDTRLEGEDRIVTFADGTVLREVLVDLDDDARRLAWSVVDGPYTHHNGCAQVFSEGDDHARFVWTADLLPNDLAARTDAAMEQGTNLVKKTLEGGAVR
jgi:Polyketide cyclase / dehydrase and lipid transport